MNINNFCQNKIFSKEMETEKTDLFKGVYIPKRFRKEIIRHILLNYSGRIDGLETPLFLAIQGSMGEGKTFMLSTLCECLNIEVHYLSGSELCGPNEGDSKDKIKRKYEEACVKFAATKKLSVISVC